MSRRVLIAYGLLAAVLIVGGSVWFFLRPDFSAYTPQPLCVATADQQTDDCGTGGTVEEPDPCDLEATTTTTQAKAIVVDEDCVCELDEQFPPAHDGATETTHQSAVQKADGESKGKLDGILKDLANKADQYSYPLKRLLIIAGGRDVDGTLGKQITEAFYTGLSTAFNDPVNLAKIESGVMNPVTIYEKAIYEALTLPKKEKHYRSDPASNNSDRQWKFFEGIKPDLTGWPSNLTLNGLKFKALNYTSSNGQYTLCIEGGIGQANGGWNFNVTGIEGSARLGNQNGALVFTVGFNGNAQAKAALFGSFRF